ncbi:hypothetical protein AZ032_002748, partial [Klebsiella pneumoniae]
IKRVFIVLLLGCRLRFRSNHWLQSMNGS